MIQIWEPYADDDALAGDSKVYKRTCPEVIIRTKIEMWGIWQLYVQMKDIILIRNNLCNILYVSLWYFYISKIQIEAPKVRKSNGGHRCKWKKDISYSTSVTSLLIITEF